LSEETAVRVIDVEDMDPGSFAISPAAVGATLVALEKPPSLIALRAGLDAVTPALKGRLTAFFAGEIGGLQCIFPLLAAAQAGLPLLDGDGMGRAFPEMQMTTFSIYGTTRGLPHALSSDRGILPLPQTTHPEPASSSSEPPGIHFERAIRKACTEEGGLIYLTAVFDQESLSRTLVRGSISLALRIGRAVESSRATATDPIRAIIDAADGKALLVGKVVDVERQFRAGHDWGTVRVEGVDEAGVHGRKLALKNEYLIEKVDNEFVLPVPALITRAESKSGPPVSPDILSPGLGVTVLALPASPLLTTPVALKSVGPSVFGYKLPYISFRSA